MASVNREQLFFELSSQETTTRELSTQFVREEYLIPAAETMQRAFETHDVTVEIGEGISASNYSNTLRGKFGDGSYQNLFSFIGFFAGDSPTDYIRPLLQIGHPSGPQLKYISAIKRRLKYRFQILGPEVQDIYNATPMPWANGLSWAERIERGIPGLSRFLNTNKAKNSLSGGGIQIKKNIRNARFAPTSYLSEIINEFIRSV